MMNRNLTILIALQLIIIVTLSITLVFFINMRDAPDVGIDEIRRIVGNNTELNNTIEEKDLEKKFIKDMKKIQDLYVDRLSILTYEKIIKWASGLVLFASFIGALSVSLLSYKVWDVRRHIDNVLDSLKIDKDNLEKKLMELSTSTNKAEKKYNNYINGLGSKIVVMEKDVEKMKVIRKKALQDIDDIIKILTSINIMKDDKSSMNEGYVKYCNIDINGNKKDILWTQYDKEKPGIIPQYGDKIKANTYIFLRQSKPEIDVNEVILSKPKRIIPKDSVVEVSENEILNLDDGRAVIWLYVKLNT